MIRRVGRWTRLWRQQPGSPGPLWSPRKIPKKRQTSPRTWISRVTSGRTLVSVTITLKLSRNHGSGAGRPDLAEDERDVALQLGYDLDAAFEELDPDPPA